nr:ABC transporter permease subunit [Lachnospiraceae bacterium]
MQGRMGKLKEKHFQKVKKALVIVFWLALWQSFTFILNNSILLSGPLEVFAYLKDHILTVSFWKTVGNSFFHIFSGFFAAFITGFLLGIFAAKHPLLEALLSPFFQFVKAVPVASFVVLLLIFAGSKRLSVSVTFLMVLPIIYQNVLEGIKNTDAGLWEMAQVYKMSLWNRCFFIYRPSLMPFLM